MNGLALDSCRKNGYPCIELNMKNKDIVEKCFMIIYT